ncbi:hypothetical protein [Pseudolysinimonas sp.]|jgi:hypothetical protein|uniref:hypothetical protein n=1 Tax=Pseudolysinimonas sp. TaxID=2680009 RepID=UPI003783459B
MITGTLVVLVFAALAVVALQVMDAVLGSLDAASVRDTDEPDAVTRTRFRELFWTLAVTATLAVIVAFGVAGAARLVFDDEEVAAGVGVLVVSAVGAFAVGMVGVVAILRRERPTYARLRRDLRDRSTFTVTPEELAELEGRLDRADRLRARRPRAATGLRIVGLALVLAVAVVVVVDGAAADGVLWGLVGGALLEIVAFVIALRVSAIKRVRVEGVLEQQRDEVVGMLERARIPQRGQVPGLRDRVARALAILREKQR